MDNIQKHRLAITQQIMSLGNDIEKGRKVPIGTVHNGLKKIAEGKWVPVKKDKKPKSISVEDTLDDIQTRNKEILNQDWSKIKEYGKLYSGHYKKLFSGKNKNILTVTIFLNNPKYKKIKNYAKKLGFDVWETITIQTAGRGRAYGTEMPAIIIKKKI